MIAVYGKRSLYTSIPFLRLFPSLSRGLASSSFKMVNNLYVTTSWQSLRIIKPTRKVNSLYLINPPASDYSTKSSPASIGDKEIRKRILSQKTVEEQLELFKSVKNSASVVDRVIMLFSIAKMTKTRRKQKQVVDQESEQSHRVQGSTYMELLEGISTDISECQLRDLANVLWALGKLREKEHRLVQLCLREILSRNIAAFSNVDVSQIVNGCANLKLRTPNILRKLQEVILNGHVNIRHFNNHALFEIFLSFSETQGGSAELFDVFLEEIVLRDFVMFESRALPVFLLPFVKSGVKAEKLFHRVEEEILRRGTTDFHYASLNKILWAFATANKGSEDLFYAVDDELFARGVERSNKAALLNTVWCFAKRNVSKAKVFDLVKKEVFNHGVQAFQRHELALMLWSFVSTQRHDDKLVAEIEDELWLKNVDELSNGHLCLVAWSLGRAGKSDSKLFDAIEKEVFQRGSREFSLIERNMLLRGFIEAKRGSKDFYELLLRLFSTSDFCNLTAVDICEFAWCFSNVPVDTGTLLDALENEILIKDKNYFSQRHLHFIKHIFRKVGKGSKKLFEL